MLPDRVSNPGPLTYESGALPIALRGPHKSSRKKFRLRRNAYGHYARTTDTRMETLRPTKQQSSHH